MTRHYALAAAPRQAASRWHQLAPMTWPGLVAWLALSEPADTKDCGGYVVGELIGQRRTKKTVSSRSMAALDADKASGSFVADAATKLGCALAYHTTWSHTLQQPRYRLLVPLSRDVTPDEYRMIVQALMVCLGHEQFDPTCDQPERFMHRPSTQGNYEHGVIPGDPLDADEWLARAKALGLDSGPQAERAPYIDDSPERDVALGVHPYAAAAIGTELAKLDALTNPWQEGDCWDPKTFAVACVLIEFANSNWSGYSLEQAEADLFAHAPADEAWGAPQHAAKWLSALNRIGPKGRSRPQGDPADDFDVVPDEDASEDGQDLARTRERFPRLDLAELLDPDRPPRQWFWDQVIPMGDQASIIAPGGTGKSLLTLALCMAAVSGEPAFIGRPLNFAGQILYVDMENSADDWAERLGDLGWTNESIRAVADRFIPLSLPPLRGLDTAEGARQLKAVVRAYGIGRGDILVLDSTQRVTEGEENSNDTLRALYNRTSAWLKVAGIAVIRTDNTGWDQSRERGASAKRDDVGYALLLEPVGARKDGKFRLTKTKHRSRGEADTFTFVRRRDEDGRLAFSPYVPTDTFDPVEMPAHQQDALFMVWVRTNPADPRYEADMVSQERALTGVKGNNEAKRNGLEQLVKEGYLTKVPYINKDGTESTRPPGVTITAQGQVWVADQGKEWVNHHLTELAKGVEK